ncbi:hypothetical protein FQN50_001752 [Emmonsiellopsis sp. PD_5]|nr:hypothetical protein FQN50_001752 [Emmonsiellopsis sp. PD_5]
MSSHPRTPSHTRAPISSHTPSATPTRPHPRGLYTNNTWTCDCTPRQPAACFQTRKGGVNQGRWFYTCPRPRDEGCRFFLWVDEAGVREGGGGVAVAAPDTPYVTPLRTGAGTETRTRTGLLTPNTGMGTGRKRVYDGDMSAMGESTVKMRRGVGRGRRREVVVKREVVGEGDDEGFGWDEGLEDGFVGRRRDDDMPMPGTMRKSPGWFRGAEWSGGWEGEGDGDGDGDGDGRGGGRDSSPSPCPRPRPRHSESGRFSPLFLRDSPAAQPPSTPQTPSSTQNPLTTPSRSTTSANPFDISTPQTPTPIRFNPPPPPSTTSLTSTRTSTSTSTSSTTPGTIVSQTLALLTKHSINMPPAAKQELVALLNTHHLRTQGIIKGRDISRLAIKTREERIRALMGRVEGLEAEREAWRVGRLRERGRGED